MNRTRRVATTIAAATGLLGAAGAAAATGTGLIEAKAAHDETAVAAVTSSGQHHPAGDSSGQAATDGRATLEDYIATMSQRADHLGLRVGAAEGRLAAARTARARLVALVREQAAALARAQAVAEQATVTSRPARTAAPKTHTSTGASSGGSDDGNEHGDDGGEGGDDD